jgi:hypothetical protein
MKRDPDTGTKRKLSSKRGAMRDLKDKKDNVAGKEARGIRGGGCVQKGRE